MHVRQWVNFYIYSRREGILKECGGYVGGRRRSSFCTPLRTCGGPLTPSPLINNIIPSLISHNYEFSASLERELSSFSCIFRSHQNLPWLFWKLFNRGMGCILQFFSDVEERGPPIFHTLPTTLRECFLPPFEGGVQNKTLPFLQQHSPTLRHHNFLRGEMATIL